MIRYYSTTVEMANVKICDVCNMECGKDDYANWQEFHHIRFTGGYGSYFGDRIEVKLDICDKCFKDILGNIWEKRCEREDKV